MNEKELDMEKELHIVEANYAALLGEMQMLRIEYIGLQDLSIEKDRLIGQSMSGQRNIQYKLDTIRGLLGGIDLVKHDDPGITIACELMDECDRLQELDDKANAEAKRREEVLRDMRESLRVSRESLVTAQHTIDRLRTECENRQAREIRDAQTITNLDEALRARHS